MSIAELLSLSVESKASDLHLSAGLAPMIRIDGQLQRLDLPALAPEAVNALLYEIMNESQRKEFEATCEVDFSFTLSNLARFRANIFNQQRGPAGVFRIIPTTVASLEELDMPQVFKTIAVLRSGLVLVTGATGCGKSTTLAALVDYINTERQGHILTIEDPIEFIHTSKQSLITQREVYRHTLSFEQALRSALREDPDVLLIGELRDPETIRLALTAAQTGHLVLATLHTSSAPKAIDRLVDVFAGEEKNVIRLMLAETLQAVIAQTLVKKKEKGRIAAYEIMVNSPAIRNLIKENKVAQIYSAMQTGHDGGMCTLDQYLNKLYQSNKITLATVKEFALTKSL